MMILTAFERALNRMREKNWDCIYVAVDIHDTIFRGCYHDTETYEWLGRSKECLQMMTKLKYIKLILWSSCHQEELDQYIKVFEENDIHFDYINSNPEVQDDDLASYKEKFYFNVGLDDKFGFVEDGWKWIIGYLKLFEDCWSLKIV